MSPDIYGNIVQRDRLLKAARDQDTPEAWKAYKDQRNKTFRLIRSAKGNFFQDSQHNSTSPKEFWKHLKSALGTTLRPTVSAINVEERVSRDPVEIANAFNEFFVSVAAKFRSVAKMELDMRSLAEFERKLNQVLPCLTSQR